MQDDTKEAGGQAEMSSDSEGSTNATSNPCSRCSCSGYVVGGGSSVVCARSGCGHGPDDHGI